MINFKSVRMLPESFISSKTATSTKDWLGGITLVKTDAARTHDTSPSSNTTCSVARTELHAIDPDSLEYVVINKGIRILINSEYACEKILVKQKHLREKNIEPHYSNLYLVNMPE